MAQVAALPVTAVASLQPEVLASLSATQVAALTPVQAQQMTATQVDALSPAQVAALTPAVLAQLPVQVLASLDVAQLEALSPVQLQALTQTQVQALPVAVLASLNTQQLAAVTPDLSAAQQTAVQEIQTAREVTPALAQNLSSAALDAYTPAQVAGLQPQALASIAPSVLGSLSEAQVAAITPVQAAQITVAQLDQLSPAQVSALTPLALASLTPTVLASLAPEQVSVLAPEQVSSLSVAQVAALPVQLISALNPKQLVALQPQVFAALSAEAMSTLSLSQLASITPDQAARISSSQVDALRPVQLAAMEPLALAKLNPMALASLDASQLVALTPEQLQAFSAFQVASLHPTVLASLDAEQLAALQSDLSAAQQAALQEIQTAQAITAQAAASLSVSDVQLLSPAAVAGLQPEALASLSAPAVSSLTVEQIAAVTPAQVAQLTAGQLDGLNASQISAISAPALSGISPAALASLEPGQLAALTVDQIGALNAQQVIALDTTQLALLSANQVAALPLTVLSSLSAQQLAVVQTALTSEQQDALADILVAQAIAPATVAAWQASDVAALSAVEISALQAPAIALMTPAVIGALSLAQTEALTPEQVAELSGAQVLALSPAQLSVLSGPAFAQLDTSAIAVMDAAQVAVLTSVQIGAMTAEQVAALPVTVLASLGAQQLAAISAELTDAQEAALQQIVAAQTITAQSAALLQPSQISALTPAAITGLQPEAVASLSVMAVAALSDLQIEALTPVQIAELSGAQIEALTPQQMANFSSSQLAALDVQAVSSLSGAQLVQLDSLSGLGARLADLNIQSVSSITGPQLATISDLDSLGENLSGLSASTVAQISSSQLATLSDISTLGANIAHLSTSAITALSPTLWAQATDEQLSALSVAQYTALADAGSLVLLTATQQNIVTTGQLPPVAPSIALQSDSGNSQSDGVTRLGTIGVTGLISGANWEYQVDGGAWVAGNGNSFEASAGTHTYAVRQTLKVSNPGYVSATLAVTLDTAGQTPSLSLANDTGTAGDRITKVGAINVQGLEAGATWQYSVDGGNQWLNGSGSRFILVPGSYAANALQVKQTDAAGNISNAGVLAQAITVDDNAAAPTLVLATDAGVSASDGITKVGTVNVGGVEAGGSWQYSTNAGTTWADGTGSSFTLTAGAYAAGAVQVRQTDVAGNVSVVASNAATIRVDATAPTWTGSTPADGDFRVGPSSDLTIQFAEEVSAGSGNIRIVNDTDGNTFATVAMSDSTQVMVSGNQLVISPSVALTMGKSYHIEIDAGAVTDVAGNAFAGISGSTALNFTVPDPALSIEPVTANNIVNATENVSSVAFACVLSSNTASIVSDAQTGDFTVTLSQGGQSVAVGNLSYDPDTGRLTGTVAANTLQNGAYTVSVVFNYGAQSLTTTGSLQVDTQAPAAPVLGLVQDTGSSASDGITKSGSMSVSGLEALGQWEYSTDGGSSWSSGSGSGFMLSAGTYAANAIQVRQTDLAGNVSVNTVRSTALVVDQTVATPSLTLATDTGTSSMDGISKVGAITVSGLEAGAVWQYSTNGGNTWAVGTGNSFSLSSGTYAPNAIQVKQTDQAGNSSPVARLSSAVTVDNTAPTVLSVTPSWGDSLSAAEVAAGGTVTVTTSGVEDGQSVSLTLNGQAYSASVSGGVATVAIGATPLQALTHGQNYTLVVNVSDMAGNAASVHQTSSFVVDTLAPSIVTVVPSWGTQLNAVEAAAGGSVTGTTSGLENGEAVTLELNGETYTGFVSVGSATISLSPSALQSLTHGSQHALTINARDAAGNPAATHSSVGFVVDLQAPAAPTLVLATDAGVSASDGITKVGTVNVGGVEAGGSWQYSTNAGTTWADGTGSSFTLTAGAYAAGAVQVRQTDVAGNVSVVASNAATIRVDATAPTWTGSTPADGDFRVGPSSDLTIQFAEEVSAGSGNIRIVNDTDGNTFATVAMSDSTQVMVSGNQLVISPSVALTMGKSYHIEIDAGAVTDVAGNAFAGISGSTALNFTVPDPALSIEPVTANNIVNATENVSSVAFACVLSSNTASIVSDAQTGDFTVTLSQGGQSVAVGNLSYDPDTGRLTGTVAANTLQNGAYTVSVVFNYGAQSLTTTGSLQVDTQAPAAPVLGLVQDTGSSASDGITKSGSMSVSGLEALGQWEYSTDGGSSWSSGSGSGFMLSAGTYAANAIQVRQTDLAGNTSAVAQRAAALTIDTTAPSITSVTPSWGGILNMAEALAGGTVNVVTTGVENGQVITLRLNGVDYTATVSNNSASVTVGSAALQALTNSNTYTLTANVSDAAGNAASANTSSSFVVGAVALSPALAIKSGEDPYLNAAESAVQLEVSYVGMTAGDVLQLQSGGVNTGNAYTVLASDVLAGKATLALSKAALGVDGTKSITATVTDAFANMGTSNAQTITVDTGVPTATVTTAVIPNSASATIQSTEVGTAYLVNSSVAVTNLASISAAADNQWNQVAVSAANTATPLAATGLVDGTYKLYVTDAAGNLSAASANSVSISSVASLSNITLDLAAVSDAGISSTDNLTNVQTPVVTVSSLNGKSFVAGDKIEIIDTSNANAVVGSYTVLAGDLTGGVWSGTTKDITLSTSLSAGAHALAVRAKDAFNNTGTASTATLTVTLDITGPGAPTINGLMTSGGGDTLWDAHWFNMTFGEDVYVTAGSSLGVFTVGGVAVDVTFENYTSSSWLTTTTNPSRYVRLTHTILDGESGQAAIDEAVLKNVLVAKIRDKAGNAASIPGTIANIDSTPLPVVLDATRPALASVVNISGDGDGVYEQGEVVQYTFSEPVRYGSGTLTISELTLGVADLSGYTFTPQDPQTVNGVAVASVFNLVVGAAPIAAGTKSLPNSKIEDAIGNPMSANYGSTLYTFPNQTIDTQAPTASFTAATDNVGSVVGVLASGASTDDTSLALSGTCEAGSTVAVYNGTTLLGAATVTGTSWSYMANVANGTTYQFNVKETDAAGNTGAATSNFTVVGDTAQPTIAITSDKSNLKVGETATLTFTFSEDPGSSFVWNGTTGDVVVTGGTLGAISGTGLTRTATFTPTANTASANASITVAAATYTDAAGNVGGAGTTPSLSIDTLAPILSISSDNSALKAGETATITFAFSEDPGSSFVWNGATGDVVVTGGTLGAISGTGLTRTAIFTPTANVNNVTANISVAAGAYTDTAGNTNIVTTSPSLSGSRLQSVNAGADSGAQVTVLTDGGYVVTWQGATGDGQGKDIYVQRYTSANALVGSAQRLRGMSGALDDAVAQVTALSGGAYVVAWQGATSDSQGTDIFVQRFDSANSAVGSPQRLQGLSGDLADANLQVNALGGGGYVVVWQSATSNAQGNDVFVQSFDGSGTALGALHRLQGQTGNLEDGGVQVTELVGGGYVVAWHGLTTTQDYDIFIQRYNSQSVATGSVIQTRNRSDIAVQDAWTDVLPLSNGGFVVAWYGHAGSNNWQVFVRQYDSAGGEVAYQSLHGTSGPAYADKDQKLAALSDGGYVVAWQGETASEADGVYDIFVQRYSSAGVAVGSLQTVGGVAGRNDQLVQVAGLTDGGYVLAWEGSTALEGYNIFVQRYDSANNAVGAVKELRGQAGANADSAAQITALPNGGYVVTWSGATTDGQLGDVFVQRFDALNNPVLGSGQISMLIDTSAPIANLTAVTDNAGGVTGTLTNGASTDDPTLVLSGTCESGSTVAVYNGTTLLGAATVSGTSWTYTATVANGTTYQFNVKETDAAGNASAATSNFTVVGDTSAQVPSLALATDSGAGAGTSDFYTNSGVISVSGLEVGASWQYSTNGGSSWSASATASATTGSFTLPQGSYGAGSIQVRQVDLAGNSSSAGTLVHPTLGGLRIQSGTGSADTAPQVKVLSDGSYVVLWQATTSDSQGSDVFLQRYSSNNVATGALQRLRGVSGLLDDINARMTALNDGGYVVVWDGATSDSQGTDVFVQRFDSSNTTVGTLQRLKGISGDLNDYYAQVAAMTDGGYVVTWQGYTGGSQGNDVFVQRYDAANVPVGSVVRLQGESGNRSDQNVQILALANGSYVLAWSGGTSASHQDIFVQAFDANNSPVGLLRPLQADSGTKSDYWVQLSATKNSSGVLDGGYVVTWQGQIGPSYVDTIVVRYDSSHQLVGNRLTLQGAGAVDDFVPQVTVLNNGDYVVAWVGDTGSGSQYKDIYLERYSGDTRVGAQQVFRASSGRDDVNVQVTALADGGYVVVWQGNTQSQAANVIVRRYDQANNLVGSQFELLGLPGANIDSVPQVSALSDGGYVIAWEGVTPDGQIKDIFAQRFDANNVAVLAPGQLSLVVDTTAPTANLTAVTDDVGTIVGNLTSGARTDDTSLVLTGINEAGSSVAVYNGTTLLGAATVSGTAWTYTATVADGATYQFNVKETDAAGNVSAATSNFTVTGDTTAPSIASVTSSWGSILGVDEAAAAGTVTIVTSGIENGRSVTVRLNGVDYTGVVSSNSATVTVAAAGLQALSPGQSYSLTVNVSDAAGNAATPNTSTTFSVSNSTAASLSNVSLDLATASDTGYLSTDNVTSVQTPVISLSSLNGKNFVAGDKIEIFDTSNANAVVGSYTVVSGDLSGGAWNRSGLDITLSTLSPSLHALKARVTDAAGESGVPSSSDLSVTVDVSSPTIVSISTPINSAPRIWQAQYFTIQFNQPVSIDAGDGMGIFTVGGVAVPVALQNYTSGSVSSATPTEYVRVTHTNLEGQAGQAVIDEAVLRTQLLSRVKDAAGNVVSIPNAINNVDATPLVIVDAVRPKIVSVENIAGDGDSVYEPGEVVRYTFSEKIMTGTGLWDFQLSQLGLGATAGDSVLTPVDLQSGYASTFDLVLGSTSTVVAGQKSIDSLRMNDIAGNSGASTATFFPYTFPAQTFSSMVTDLSAITLDLAAISDSGNSSTDNLTNIQTPVITVSSLNGKSFSAGDIVQIIDTTNSNAVVGSYTIQAGDLSSGAWTGTTLDITLSSSLGSGTHALKVRANSSGATGALSSTSLAVAIDITAPTLTLNSVSETGVTFTASDSGSTSLLAYVGATDLSSLSIANGSSTTLSVSEMGSLLTGALYVRDAAGNLSSTGNGSIELGVGTSAADSLTSSPSKIVIRYGFGGNDSLTSGGFNDYLFGGEGNDYLHGWESNDTVYGGNGNDTLYGGNGDDIINGGSGDDALVGQAGNDVITLGAGIDSIRFDSLTGADTIIDFVVGEDIIRLAKSAMAALGATGALTVDEFVSGAGLTAGQDATDRVVYNTTNGKLYYDADGSDAGAAVLLATFSNNPLLLLSDFTVV